MDDLQQIGANNLELGVALHQAIGGLHDKGEIEISQIQDVAEFFNDYPNAVETLNRVAQSNKNPNIKNLDHLTAFVLLSKKKLSILDSLDKINNELKYYG